MNLSTVEIPRAGARERAAEYRRAAKRAGDGDDQRELLDVARAYELAAKEDVALIALSPTLAAGGTVQRTRVYGHGAQERREDYLLPALAVAPATSRFTHTLGIERDGRVRFCDQLDPHWNYERGRISIDPGTFELPDGFEPGRRIDTWVRAAWTAMVPLVPPEHRPPRGLGSTIVLWEVENWAWYEAPRPPGDPALLRHLAGDLYAVLAVWQLTELEQLVLSGRRP